MKKQKKGVALTTPESKQSANSELTNKVYQEQEKKANGGMLGDLINSCREQEYSCFNFLSLHDLQLMQRRVEV